MVREVRAAARAHPGRLTPSVLRHRAPHEARDPAAVRVHEPTEQDIEAHRPRRVGQERAPHPHPACRASHRLRGWRRAVRDARARAGRGGRASGGGEGIRD